jgi:Xaa-Pro dipeptidase
MRQSLELPRLSITERDRRWALIREHMKDQGLDCLVLFGMPTMWDFTTANARFVTHIGGNAAFNITVFPLHEDPTVFVQMPTFVEYWKRSQDWVTDIRARKGTWAQSIAQRLNELCFGNRTVGVDGLAGPLDQDGWTPYSVYDNLTGLLPEARFVNLMDMMEKIRVVKSNEEIEFLEKAAHLGDLMLAACAKTAQQGVKECEVYAKMTEVMITNGGEEPTLFLWASDAHPLPHPFRLPTTRPLEKGDLITCEMHPKYGGYYTHLERTFSLGKPDENYLRIHAGCLKTFRRVMELCGPGKPVTDIMEEAARVIAAEGLGICEAGIHGHGLSSLEYPRFRLHALETDRKAVSSLGAELRPGMVFALNIDLVDPNWMNGETGCVFAETIVVTEKGARRLHSFPDELRIIE